MELSRLYYFETVAKFGHVTAAAEALHVAQPALTRAIKQLEEELGVPLFCRKGRGIALTEYGKLLQETLQPILQTLDELPGRLRSMADEEAQTVRVQVLAASTLLTEAIIAYKTDHPALRFQLLQGSGNERCDILVTTRRTAEEAPPAEIPTATQEDGTPYLRVFREEIYLAVPQNSRYAADEETALASTAKEGFLCLLGSLRFREICDDYCREAGFFPKIIFESDNPAAVRNMIAAGLGVGFWPEFSWGPIHHRQIKLQRIQRDPFSSRRCLRDLLLAIPLGSYGQSRQKQAAIDFFRFLGEFFERKQSGAAPESPLLL